MRLWFKRRTVQSGRLRRFDCEPFSAGEFFKRLADESLECVRSMFTTQCKQIVRARERVCVESDVIPKRQSADKQAVPRGFSIYLLRYLPSTL